MAIRRRFNKPKIIAYHRRYGSIKNPPLSAKGKEWPNGSLVTSQNVPGLRGQVVPIGWICDQVGCKSVGLWICTKIGVSRPFKKYPIIDLHRSVDYAYVTSLPEDTQFFKLLTTLVDAYAEKHDLLM